MEWGLVIGAAVVAYYGWREWQRLREYDAQRDAARAAIAARSGSKSSKA